MNNLFVDHRDVKHCPFCGSKDIHKIEKGNDSELICEECKQEFSVTTNK